MTENEHDDLANHQKGQCLLASRLRFANQKQPCFEIEAATDTHYSLYDTVNKGGCFAVSIEDVVDH